MAARELTQHELARAVALAALAHSGQVDKSGKAYILHPLRVMARCEPHGLAVQIAAVLHDVVEDTWVTLALLRAMGLPDDVVEAVDALTERDGERYFDYIRRCAKNRIGALVKLADLEDNSDPRRRFGLHHESLLERYRKAKAIVEEEMAG